MTNRLMRILALLFAFALLASACGDDSEGSDGDDDTDVATDDDDTTDDDADDAPADDDADDDDAPADDDDDTAELTASFKGVTADTITIGVSYLDFVFLNEQFGISGWGDQEGVWQALIDDLNNRGGINGRKVEAVYDGYKVTQPEDAARSCTALTEDFEVFAVLGGYLNAAATENPCIVDLNETMLIGGEINPDQLSIARAPWYDVSGAADRATEVLLDLLVDRGDAAEAEVFLLSNLSRADNEGVIEDALAERNISRVESAVLDADDENQSAQDAVMQVISKRIRSSGANTVFINGNPTAPLRGLIAAGLMGEVDVWTNQTDGLNNLGPSVERADAEGVIAQLSATDQEMFEEAQMTNCTAIVQAAFPDVEIIEPDVITEDEENWFNSIRRYCRLLSLFEQLATQAGPDLTYDSIVEAANGEYFDDFAIPGNSHASLSPDKPDAQDEYRLGVYSATESDGGVAADGPLVDIFP